MHKIATATALMLSLGACETIDLGPVRPSADKFVCEALPETPDLRPLQAFQADNGAWVYLKADVDARDARIATYIVNLRGAWFS